LTCTDPADAFRHAATHLGRRYGHLRGDAQRQEAARRPNALRAAASDRRRRVWGGVHGPHGAVGARTSAPSTRHGKRALSIRVVEALAAIRSSRFDLPLTYDAGDLELDVGDVVRVPLGNRDVLAFVVSPVREVERIETPLKPVAQRLDVPRAFDETGLHLARF